MESATDATDHLKAEYLRLRRDIHENDKCIEAARRKNASQLRQLNQLLHKRSTLAHQVCQFAQKFTDTFADHHESQAEMESLRSLIQSNREHIRGLTTAIAGLHDDHGAAGSHPVTEKNAESGILCGPAAGDERSAPNGSAGAGATDPQLRPKDEFLQKLRRYASKNEEEDGKSRRAARLKHPEGNPTMLRHHKLALEPQKKTKATASGASSAMGHSDMSPTDDQQSPAISSFVYGLILVATLSSVPFLCPDATWQRVLDKYLRTPSSQPPVPHASPMSVLQRARNLCGLI